jgi:crotonobetainyl-CoA:carnitine CoA-transferase CaiB-like acyl-CoA transferase
MEPLFRSLRVVDLSTVLAGPSVGMFFSELGADVTKIENPRTQGDVTRHWKLPGESPDSPVSAYFASVNFGKNYEWLDLGDPASRPRIESLLRDADILISNFKEGDAAKFRLGDAEIAQLNPRLIHGKIAGFASDSSRVAFDVVLQAETGYMYMNGTSESGPVKMPVALIDVLAAHQLKEGLLCALLRRSLSGEGGVVSVSLEEAGLSALSNQASNYLMTGHIPRRIGSCHPNIAPYGETFECADGKSLVLAVGSEKQFQHLCALLERPDLPSDPRFRSNQERVIHRDALHELMAPVFRMTSREEWISLFIRHHVPAGAIRDMSEVMTTPAAGRMILEETHDGLLTRRMSSVAFTLT